MFRDEELLGYVGVDVEVTGAAEYTRSSLAEIRLDGRRDARGRIIGFKVARGEARWSRGVMNHGAISGYLREGGRQNGAAETAARVDLRVELAVRGGERQAAEDIHLAAEGPAASHEVQVLVTELRLLPNQIGNHGAPPVDT